MIIDDILPGLLEARGVPRRRYAAALRTINESSYTNMPIYEAQHLIREALGSFGFGDGRYGGERYDAAIDKGVRLLSRNIGHSGTITGITVVVDKEIPASAANALVGEPLRQFIDHRLLPGDARIAAVRTGPGETEVDIWVDQKSIAVLAPASQRDMHVESGQWIAIRRREAHESGATVGLAPEVVMKGAKAFTKALITTLVVAGLLALPGISAFVSVPIAILLSAAYTTVVVNLAMGDEDHGLKDRIEDARSKHLIARRRAILEGGEVPPIRFR